MTRNEEFLLYVVAVVACQLWTALRLWRALGRRRGGGYAPSVSVIVPCKGAIPGLAEHARALLAQEYPRAEFLFTTPSRADPAYALLEPVVAGRAGVRLLAAEAAPPRLCTGKIVDLLFALERTDPRSEVLVFVDADLKVRPRWLESIVQPLREPEVGAATSCALYVPRAPGLWSAVRMAWLGLIVPYAILAGHAFGHTMAIRRETFRALDVAGAWSRAFLEDVVLTRTLGAAGKKIVFVGEAMAASGESCGAGEFFGVTIKWVKLMKIYDPALWLGALAAVFVQAWIVFWCLRPPLTPALPLLLLLGDALALGLTFVVFDAREPGLFAELHPSLKPVWLWTGLAAPLVWASCLIQLVASAPGRVIRWGGRRYKVRGPRDVEALG